MRALTPSSDTPVLPAALHLGPVHLTVRDLDRSVTYYQAVAGLRQHARTDQTATLGAGETDLLVLHEDPLAQPAARSAGLFHVALLYPTPLELSLAARRIAAGAHPLSGASDHGVSEALYLRDPDGNGVELYVDRPQEQWPAAEPGTGARVGMFTRPLDIEALLAHSDRHPPAPHAAPGLTVGHVHLQVGSVADALAFYRDVLGFELMTTYPGAAFLAAGGYHHHLAVNTWAGASLAPAPPHSAGLREWSIALGDADAVRAVRARVRAAGIDVRDDDLGFVVEDPWGIALRVTV